VTTRAVTDPLRAAQTALAALGARSVALVTPYVASVTGPIRAAFEAAGLSVPAITSFDEKSEARVARIDPASTVAAALAVGRAAPSDAVFLSCTNLRTLEIIDTLEDALDRPVLSSNLCLAWHMARLAGAPVSDTAPCRLFRHGLP